MALILDNLLTSKSLSDFYYYSIVIVVLFHSIKALPFAMLTEKKEHQVLVVLKSVIQQNTSPQMEYFFKRQNFVRLKITKNMTEKTLISRPTSTSLHFVRWK